MLPARIPADWRSTEPHLWSWGDWFIMETEGDESITQSNQPDPNQAPSQFFLLVGSGIEYGPFASLAEAQQHAEHVRGD